MTHNCQNIWRKTILKNGEWQCFRRRSWHSVKLTIVSRLLLIDRKWKVYACRWPSIIFNWFRHQWTLLLTTFMLLESYGVSSPPYIKSKWNLQWWMRNPLPFDENIITEKSQHKKNSETSKSTLFSIQNQWKKVWFWMSNTRDNQQFVIEDAHFDMVLSSFFFYQKKLHNDFFWK